MKEIKEHPKTMVPIMSMTSNSASTWSAAESERCEKVIEQFDVFTLHV